MDNPTPKMISVTKALPKFSLDFPKKLSSSENTAYLNMKFEMAMIIPMTASIKIYTDGMVVSPWVMYIILTINGPKNAPQDDTQGSTQWASAMDNRL